MPIKCRFIEYKDGIKLKPGDMFYNSGYLIVILPNKARFNLTSAERLWKITGEPPEITVTPSINMDPNWNHEGWHGYLTNGELSDDLEGRNYD